MKNKTYISVDGHIKVKVVDDKLVKVNKNGKLNKKYILVEDLDTNEYAAVHIDNFNKMFKEYTEPEDIVEQELVDSIIEDLKETFGIDDLDPEDIIIRKL